MVFSGEDEQEGRVVEGLTSPLGETLALLEWCLVV